MPEYKRRPARRRAPVEQEREVATEGDAATPVRSPEVPKDTVSLVTVPSRYDAKPPSGAQRKQRIRNNTGQLVTCSVLSEDGCVQPVRLLARATSAPFLEAHITDYTRNMVARGTLSLVR